MRYFAPIHDNPILLDIVKNMSHIHKIPLEDFFRNPEKSSFQISPDGKCLSFLAPWNRRLNIFVQQTGDKEAVRLTSETERDIAGYMWKGNGRILFVKDVAGDENYQLFGIDLSDMSEHAYTPFKGVKTTLIDDLEEVPDAVIIGLNKRNAEVFDPYKLELLSGKLTILAENPGNYQGWTTDHDGCLRAVTAIVDGVNTQLLYRDNDHEEFRPVITTNFKETVSIMGFTPDNKLVYAASNLKRDKLALILMEPATCKELELLYEDENYDIASISYSRKRKKLLSVYCTGHVKPVRHYFDDEAKQLRLKLEAHFEGLRVGIADCDKDERVYIVYAGSDRTPGAYYLYDSESDTASLICKLAPWLPEDEMSAMNAVTYTSRDGLRIEAYLSLPKGYSMDDVKGGSNGDKTASNPNLPVVIHPHGGPWARDYWGYSPLVQFLCNRGYAVFSMNFRGSTGLGRKFLEASYGQWGLKMQDDITDGVNYLISSGIASPSRIAIYGASYGGYAALAGATFTPDLYACAVDYVGVSNLLTFMNTIPPYWRPMLEMMYEQVGNPQTDRKRLEATSPALHADKIKCPLLIAQGANDPRVNKAESDQMVEALRKRGVEVEYMVKDNEGHGFQNEENRFDFYRAMESFFEKYL